MYDVEGYWKVRLTCVLIFLTMIMMFLTGCNSSGNNQELSATSGTITVYTAIENVLAGRLVETFNE